MGQESGINSGFRLDNSTLGPAPVSVGAITPHGGTGIGYGVNNNGMFAGTELDSGNPAFAWVSDGTNTGDLNDYHSAAGVTLQAGTGVSNTNNAISGWGDFNGNQHGFLITIPEPGTLPLVLLAGAGALAIAVWRRKAIA